MDRPPRPAAPAGVDKAIFIGSTVVGKKVMAAAADSLTPVVLELGGKDPVIFCDDVNVKEVGVWRGEGGSTRGSSGNSVDIGARALGLGW